MSSCVFSDLKVLDVGSFIAGPVAATILADFGADVIKIEPPGVGDPLRNLSYVSTTPDADSNYFWDMDGRNKRSLALDLKSEHGRAILLKLVKDCDVYITNQPFPVRDSLKLNYEDLKPLNSRLIYASLSAYGEYGPERNGKGFDLVAYWARSGLMDLVRANDSAPSQALPGMGDHPTAVALYACIVTALLQRERSNEGAMVHTSLLANGLWSAASILQGAIAGGDMAAYRKRQQTPAHWSRLYETSDKRWLQINMLRSDEDFHRFFEAIDAQQQLVELISRPPESSVDFSVQIAELIQQNISHRSSEEWLMIFSKARVSVNRVQRVEEVLEDEQLLANGITVTPEDDTVETKRILNHPLNIEGIHRVGPRRAPDVGEHAVEILEELAYTVADIRRFKEQGVI